VTRRTAALVGATSALAATALLTGTLPGPAFADGRGGQRGGDRDPAFSFALVGDMPYGDVGRARYPAVIQDVNRSRAGFTVFVGDTKNGSEPCYADPHTPDPTAVTPDRAVADAAHPDVYNSALRLFASYQRPVVYLPGDNEWTDCDRPSTDGGLVSDSNDRLAYLRRLSYRDDQTLGRRTFTVRRQSAAYPENVRWSRGPVTFIGLNVPGSDNNYADGAKNGPAAQGQAEYATRNAANLRWLKEGFAAARDAGSKGVVVAMQADMWDPTATLTHYADTKRALFTESTAFAGQVLLVNGDSHSFEVDKPLTDYATTNAGGKPGPNVVENVTRATGFGEFQQHWVSVTIDPADPMVFSFQQHLVAANLPTYTPPAG
jgi:hypothetical protein